MPLAGVSNQRVKLRERGKGTFYLPSGEGPLNMATESSGKGKDKTGASSWAGIVTGGKSDTPEDTRSPKEEETPVNLDQGISAAVAPGGGDGGNLGELNPEELSQFTEIRNKRDRAKKIKKGDVPEEDVEHEGAAGTSGGDLAPEELSQFTEIRNKRDRAKKKEARNTKRGNGRREFEWEFRDGVPKGRGGKRPGRDVALRQQNGPEGEEEAMEEGQPPPDIDAEEKVLYVPAPAPSVNIWEKRQSIPAAAAVPAPAKPVEAAPQPPAAVGECW